MATALGGALGGGIATIVMTAVTRSVGEGGPPPTAELVARVAGGDADDHLLPGMALHLLYGTLAGVVLAVAVPTVGLSMDPLAVGTALGVVYGALLMGVGMVWLRLLEGARPEQGPMVAFAAGHLVYGATLGAVLSLLTFT